MPRYNKKTRLDVNGGICSLWRLRWHMYQFGGKQLPTNLQLVCRWKRKIVKLEICRVSNECYVITRWVELIVGPQNTAIFDQYRMFDGRAHTQMYTTLQGTFGGLTAPLGERKNGKDDSLNRDGNRERAHTRIYGRAWVGWGDWRWATTGATG